MTKAQRMAKLMIALGTAMDGANSMEEVEERARQAMGASTPSAEFSADRSSLARWLTKLAGIPVWVGSHWVSVEDEGTALILPYPTDWIEGGRESLSPHTQKQVANRPRAVATPLWAALDLAGVQYEKEPTDLPGRPHAVVRSIKTVAWVRRCWYYGHNHGGGVSNSPVVIDNMKKHAADVAALVKQGYKPLVLWECMLGGPAEEAIAMALGAK